MFTMSPQSLSGWNSDGHFTLSAAFCIVLHSRRKPQPGLDPGTEYLLLPACQSAFTRPVAFPKERKPSPPCEGVITAAGRMRRSAEQATAEPAYSAYVKAASLSHAAAAGVVASHNCRSQPQLRILLRSVAVSAVAWRSVGTSAEVMGLPSTLGSPGWMSPAPLEPVISGVHGHISGDASDARDLALWTGRLTYASREIMRTRRCPHQLRMPAIRSR